MISLKLKALAFATLLCGFSSTVFAQQPVLPFAKFNVNIYNQHDGQYDYSLDALVGEDPLTLASFQRDQDLYSGYEGFLSYLENRAPEIFAQNVLLHTTGSIQHASPDRPRVLLFGRGSVISFAEQPAVAVKRVEMIQYVADKHSFEMAEIQFHPEGKVVFRHKPQVCIACHGKDARPIWRPYDVWPKAYQSFAGMFSSEQEFAAYQKFVENKDQRNEIYTRLRALPEKPRQISEMGPVGFTQYLTMLNGLRTMDRLAQVESLQPFRYAFTAAINGCSNDKSPGSIGRYTPFAEYFPAQVWAQLPLNRSELLSDTMTGRQEFIRYMYQDYEQIFPGVSNQFEGAHRLDHSAETITDVRLLLESLGLYWRDYVTNHGDNPSFITTPSNFVVDFGSLLIAYDKSLFVDAEPELHHFDQPGWTLFDCGKLKRLSQNELQNWSGSFPSVEPMKHTNVEIGLSPIARCVKCHVARTGTVDHAPSIPFDNTMKLKQWLAVGDNFDRLKYKVNSGQMPKGSLLDQEEREAVLQAMEVLIAESE